MKKIVAFAGSNSSRSINKRLVQFVLTFFNEHEYEKKLLDLNDYEMDIFSVDREEKGYPQQAYNFRHQMEDTDIIICSIAENNRSYSAAFKNVLDWCSRIDQNIFRNNPMLLMSTSPGGYGGGNVMNAAKSFFPACSANIIETFSLPLFDQNFSYKEGIVTNQELRIDLEKKINLFKNELV